MSFARLALAGVACLLLAGSSAPSALAASAPPSRSSGAELTTDRDRVSTQLGESFAFTTRVTNTGDKPLSDLVAHLNIVALTKGVYVDPEDWSAARTKYVAPLAPGRSTDLAWRVQAVNGGRLAVYVVLLSGSDAAAEPETLAVSRPVNVRISERKNLNSGGVLPLALGVPAFLALMTFGLRLRRRRRA